MNKDDLFVALLFYRLIWCILFFVSTTKISEKRPFFCRGKV